MILTRYALTLMAALVLFGCDKIKTKENQAEIQFNGIKSLSVSNQGTAILTWETPANQELAGFEIYQQDLSFEDSAPETSTEETELELTQSGAEAFGTSIVTSDLNDEEAPVAKGQLIHVSSPDLNTYEVKDLTPGAYGFQIRAVGVDGRTDTNTNVVVLSIESSLGYEGITRAELNGDILELEWATLLTTLKGEVNYTIFEGEGFNNPIAITSQTSASFSIRGKRPGSTLTYGVRATDPKGRTEGNTNTLSIEVPSEDASFVGCASAEPRGADRILVKFDWPGKEFKFLKIFRNGKQVYATGDRGVVEFMDTGLQEGEKYEYSCVLEFDELVLAGTDVIEVETLSSNAPTFSGIRKVDVVSPNSATLFWGVSSGVPVEEFKVYANPGTSVDFSAKPIAVAGPTDLQITLETLGDEQTYAFAVRACSSKNDGDTSIKKASDICDFNEVTLLADLPDGGAPMTTGATKVELVDGDMHVTAPWSPSMGGINKRELQLSIDGGAFKTEITYSDDGDDNTPPTSLLVFNRVEDNTNYQIKVVDIDASGNSNVASVVALEFNSGDTTKPVFSGITNIATGDVGFEETTLKATFVGIESEDNDKYGAKDYQVYLLQGTGNACELGTLAASYSVSDYSAGVSSEIVIENLTPLTYYSVCLKAIDAAGNVSETVNYLTKATLDVTPPSFDGIQSLVFDRDTASMVVGWNASAAADVHEYQVTVWKNSANPASVVSNLLVVPHSLNPTGFEFTSELVEFGSLEEVYVMVNACDNAGVVDGGTQNCSAFDYTSARSVQLDDVDPPPGFSGIKAEPDLLTPVEGTVTISWVNPADWTDYEGFKIYTVDDPNAAEPVLTQIKDCACASIGCPTDRCDVTGLDDFRTYNFHVRAYDSSNNLTQLNPATFSTAKRTLDDTPPSFSSTLTLAYEAGTSTLTWSEATDNQYAGEPDAVITYEVWRKTTSNFNSVTEPYNDGLATLMTEMVKEDGVDLAWTDFGDDYISGTYYYYTICARDGTGNRTCDGIVQNVLTPDLIPPVITSFTTTKSGDDWNWNLDWVASDNATSDANLLIRIRVKYSNNPLDQATEADTQIFAQTGATAANGREGPENIDTYVHYLLIVEDADGNRAEERLTLYSQNLVKVEKVRSTEGTFAGGQTIVVLGSGFKDGATVDVGGDPCGNVTVYSKQHILCETPAGISGATYDIEVTNPDASSDRLNSAYRYCDPATPGSCNEICNTPAAWGAEFASGDGLTEDTAFVICNGTHLDNMRDQPYNRYYILGDNINLSGFTANSFLPITNSGKWDFRGFIQGDNFTISDFTYDNSSDIVVGLFRYLNFSRVENLGLLNFTINASRMAGALAGATAAYNNGDWGYYSAEVIIDGVFSTGSITVADRNAGGLTGTSINNVFNSFSYATVEGRRYIGGVFGRKYWGGSNIQSFGNVTATGNNSECFVGGIAGRWDPGVFVVDNLYSEGTVTCSDTGNTNPYHTGGLMGHASFTDLEGKLKNSSSNATVVGKRRTAGLVGTLGEGAHSGLSFSGSVSGLVEVGGIAGRMYRGTITSSTVSGSVTGTHAHVGGLVGFIDGTSTEPGLIDQSSSSAVVTGTHSTGGLVGWADDFSIVDSYATGNVFGTSYTGGLLGEIYRGTITDSYATGDVNAPASDYIGGLIGLGRSNDNGSTVTGSYATGRVVGNDRVGGLAGQYRGHINNSYATGSVIGNTDIGGLIGRSDGGTSTRSNDYTRVYATGTVTALTRGGGLVGSLNSWTNIFQSYSTSDVTSPTYAGGLVAEIYQSDTTIKESFATGDVVGNTSVGGFLGRAIRNFDNKIVIENNYAKGDVKGNQDVGGFAGIAGDIISYGYSTGKVEKDASETNIGGFLGRLWSPSTGGPGTTLNSFFDEERATRSNSAGGTAKMTADMLGQTLFVRDGWDGAVWNYNVTNTPNFLWELE